MNKKNLRHKLSKPRTIIFGLLTSLIVVAACKSNHFYNAPKVSAFKGGKLPAPPGMVYVPSGTILYKSSLDSGNVGKNISLSAFFIDETEVTNKQYRQFVNWVADSVAVTDYLNDEQYFLDIVGEDGQRRIDWKRVKRVSPLWRSNDPSIQERLAPMVLMKGARRALNEEVVKYRFSYLRANGQEETEYVTDTVPVMPIADIWSKDFPNAQLASMDANYFTHESFDYYPVVGVTWKQARAYTDWRGKELMANIMKNSYLSGYHLTFSLPTEAQWQYAAEGKLDPRDTISGTRLTIDGKEGKKKLAVNYKQGEGTYSQDGATFTVPAKSYTPNAFGIYNMAGNVSEWTLDAYSPSAIAFVNDLNPVLLYDARDSDSDALKRKVVRGGSWKDNGEQLNSETRNYVVEYEPHSYIGFRCVMSAFEMPTDQSKTRRY
ncbi:SUMF1/EgtB/PvdO family nonheme iron enzyme [Sphingobacterium sp. FBM7-1]|uniref:type IX secretion system lipoprotein PorK/GldK n=1 Tax=Sphingobacterium sp. FBM7-1 TaxID=2886688 RepID=UPI001D11FE19|nr:SUMF1/EgtB/PvdO family nonheme iron enzyme [Sphingobacterium sp. FBM7-1]MCC2598725.1 SUMF1/EgtB/PvdO family nonheme iron enzyme [Sphingobacterium sp. FBM7-1]